MELLLPVLLPVIWEYSMNVIEMLLARKIELIPLLIPIHPLHIFHLTNVLCTELVSPVQWPVSDLLSRGFQVILHGEIAVLALNGTAGDVTPPS